MGYIFTSFSFYFCMALSSVCAFEGNDNFMGRQGGIVGLKRRYENRIQRMERFRKNKGPVGGSPKSK